jgi:hypothetical protein
MPLTSCLRAGLGLALALALAAPVAAQGQGQQRLAGDVVGMRAGVLTLRTTLGQTLELKAPDKLRVTERLPASLADVAPGSYVGTTAVPQNDGTLRAKEVHLFTEAQRGTGEGHYPMATPGDTMTNATVSGISGAARRPPDTMTNGTVKAAAGAEVPRLTLTYKGGEKTVVVPPGTPVVASRPGDPGLLVPGAHVVAYAHRDADGGLTLDRVSVGHAGFVPPI